MVPLQFAAKHLLAVRAAGKGSSWEIQGVYCGDRLSLAMVQIKPGDAFLTVTANVNAIAVAVTAKASCIILCEGFRFDRDALVRAEEHALCVLETGAPVFKTAVLLAQELGLV